MSRRYPLARHDRDEDTLDVSKLTQPRVEAEAVPVLAERTIVCGSEEAAEAEAARQQQLECDEADWIAVHLNGLWVAKRVPRNPPPEDKITAKGLAKELLADALNPLNWLNGI